MMRKPKVLVVDNSPVILKVVSNILEQAGCEVRTGVDGLEALDLLREFVPDILFTDLVMPNIDGAKLSHIIRETPAYRDIFLVVLSGIALEDDRNLLELGADVCIAKGPAATMKVHIQEALEQYESGKGERSSTIVGLQGLYPREVTSELLLNKRHSEVFFEQMTEGAVELDGRARIVRANTVCCTLLGLPESQLLGSDLIGLLPLETGNEIRAWMGSLSPEGEQSPLVFDYDHPVQLNGRMVTFNLVPLFEDGKLFVIGLLKDETRRKRNQEKRRQLEEELQRIRKLDAMATMASGIAHDFNNLLTIINGNVEMARVMVRDEKIDQLLEETGKALSLTTGLIRQFSTISDNYLPCKTSTCVDEFIRELLENQFAGSGLSFDVSSEDGVECVDLDPDLMLLVFHNIILNAVEAMNGSGSLQVELSRVDGEKESERIGLPMAVGDYIRIAFRDDGPGIDASIVDQVFDPYFSTKQRGAQKGMGLGLTITHAVVKKHGGAVRLDSRIGEGTTIWVYLPAGSSETVEDEESCRVLILDDDEVMRIITSRMFEQFNSTVTTAEDGQKALQLFSEALEGDEPFDLVLLDHHADNSQGDAATVTAMHRLAPDVFLVAMCSDLKDRVMFEPRQHHFVTAVGKPFSLDTVEHLLQTCIRRKQGH